MKFYDQIDWSLVDWSLIEFSKVSELEGFSLSNVDWEELNSSKNSAKAYTVIQNNYLSTPSGIPPFINSTLWPLSVAFQKTVSPTSTLTTFFE